MGAVIEGDADEAGSSPSPQEDKDDANFKPPKGAFSSGTFIA